MWQNDAKHGFIQCFLAALTNAGPGSSAEYLLNKLRDAIPPHILFKSDTQENEEIFRRLHFALFVYCMPVEDTGEQNGFKSRRIAPVLYPKDALTYDSAAAIASIEQFRTTSHGQQALKTETNNGRRTELYVRDPTRALADKYKNKDSCYGVET